MTDYAKQLQKYVAQIEGYLAQISHYNRSHHRLEESMNYSLEAGGKRIRPALTLATCQMLGGNVTKALPFAAAVEMIHTYSLIHDDLPAMDDDDMRRGKPTNHKVFGEATAILAGDGLLTAAFSQMVQAELPAEVVVRGVSVLARCAGPDGMVGGQALDMGTIPRSVSELDTIQSKKTGALLVAACRLGALAAEASDETLKQVTNYASTLGRAFQIRDDILDEIGDLAVLGKSVGSDRALKKQTYFTILGQEGAQKVLGELTAKSIASVQDLPNSGFHVWLARELELREN